MIRHRCRECGEWLDGEMDGTCGMCRHWLREGDE